MDIISSTFHKDVIFLSKRFIVPWFILSNTHFLTITLLDHKILKILCSNSVHGK